MRFPPVRSALALIAVSVAACAELPTVPVPVPETVVVSMNSTSTRTDVVISQIYGGGGNMGATLRNDFIELFNPGDQPVSLAGWSVQYASSTGTSWQTTALSGTIAAGGYYLVQEAAGAGGTVSLPTPDATGTIAMAAGAGKVALSRTTTALTAACPVSVNLVDLVSFGTTASNCGSNTTATLANATAAIRKLNGCQFTGTLGDASADFEVLAPAPRNTSSPTHSCGGTGGGLPASVTIAPDATTVIVGATPTFVATAKDADDNIVGTTYTWMSSAPGVATVDGNGVATALSAGSTTITATSANGIAGTAELTVNDPPPPPSGVTDVFISQVYGGGGNAGAQYTNDYVEIFNRGSTPVDITGWAIQYTSAAGSSWQVTPLSGTIQPGRYYLVQEAAGTGTPAPLPAPDAIGTIPMSATAGKIVLTQNTTPLTGACPSGVVVVDRVGYGTNATTDGCSDAWGGRTAATANTTAAYRKNDGCVNTGSGSADFSVLAPAPRNSASPAKSCVQPPRPASTATLVINELMGDPALAENASWGQWFEVHNYGVTPIDLKDWVIVSAGTNQPDHVITTNLVVPAGGYAVLGRGGDITRNGGVAIDYNYFIGNTQTIWLDDSDYLMLVDASGALADSVAWTSLPRGVTKALRDPLLANENVEGASWAYSTSTYGDGDYGTPGAANTPLADTPPFVSPNRITISGRVAADAPLPVGFEAQLFAALVDPGNVAIPSTFTWTSLTPGTASVDANGVIRALSAGTAIFRVVAADGTGRNHAIIMETPFASTTAQYLNSTEFGSLTTGGSLNDYIVMRTQFTSSWNGGRGIPNWVAYNLNATQIVVGQDRCNCFTFDPILEAAGFPKYTTADYTGAGAFAGYGIDRGHMTRSFDRTAGTLDNAVTYYMSNVVPQAADMNQGPWAIMENYLGDLARFQNKEVYIYTGPAGTKGTVKNEGKITIPDYTWKAAVIMPRGQGVANVTDYRDVEVVAAVMPNIPGIRNENWETAYKVTVDSVERLTGYQFLSALPSNIQRALKTGTKPPIAKLDGPYAGLEGGMVAMSGAASLDPNGTVVSHSWSFGDGNTATGSTVTHTYTQNGAYSVRLIVTDDAALVDTIFTTAVIANVAPVIAAIAAGNIIKGETYVASGSFTDPGADIWTASVDYGDGSGVQALALTGNTFSLSRLYASAGTYTVTVTVNDGVDAVVATTQVTVSTLLAGVTSAIGLLDQLVADEKVSATSSRTLRNALESAAKQIEMDKGNSQASLALLNNALKELDKLIAAGSITSPNAAELRSLILRLLQLT